MTSPAQFEGCASVSQPGARCVFGQTHDGGFAVWAVSGGAPIATWPAGDEGWRAASAQFWEWEQPAAAPREDTAFQTAAVGLAIAVAVLIALAVAIHWYRYRGCIAGPDLFDIFDWPSGCI